MKYVAVVFFLVCLLLYGISALIGRRRVVVTKRETPSSERSARPISKWVRNFLFSLLASAALLTVLWMVFNYYIQKRERTRETTAPAPVELQFCWSKPEDVTGGMSGIRGTCCPAQFNAFNSGLINFSVFHFYGGAREEQVYTLNRAEKVGTWKNNGKLPGRGTWEEMPTPVGTSVKLIGRYRDETEDNQWISFMILEKSS
ncbi:hypothetical protein IPJ70_00090 [Candidatus Campbellbacteria bacterium]|nr:MAG: hypothetical protein IPJ70_00090 [Candidatus Campbellbacteria bacterium]